jgi:hypothetical protein
MTEMPTIRQLQKKIGDRFEGWRSCGYHDSRQVLNHLDLPVVAYGIGYAGFVAVYKNKYGWLRATVFSVKKILSKWPMAGFGDVSVEGAMTEIKDSKLFAERAINQEEIDTATKREEYIRPVVGTLQVNQVTKPPQSALYNNNEEYRISRFKNGAPCIEHVTQYYKSRTELRHLKHHLLREFKKEGDSFVAQYNEKDRWHNGIVKTKVIFTSPKDAKEELQKLQMYIAAKEI